MTIQEILSHLQGVKGGGGQYMAKCPAHPDSKPSLSVGLGEDNRILLKCQAGCATEDILDAMGLTKRDLFAEVTPGDAFPDYGAPKRAERPPVVATYDFLDDNGQLLARKLRRADKSFTWCRPDGRGGWIYNRKGVPNRLYVAGKLEGCVFVAEGEKDANTLHEIGFDAASGADGAGPGKWKKEYTEQLKGLHVCVFQDNDQVGKDYAAETCNALHGVAASVRLMDLSKVWPEIPEHGDVTDMVVELGATRAAELIGQLSMSTPEWVPTAQPKGDDLKPTLVRASDVPYEPPRWLIAPYFQKGKGTLIQADNGTGKTAFVCAIAAHVTTGRPILGLNVATPGDVLILSVEDDLPVLRGRIEASGGELTHCHFMTNAAGLSFNSPEVEAAIKQINAKLVIFDPLQAFMGAKVDMFRANETRPELAKLFDMCGRNDCACIIIAHMGKSGGDKSPVNRALGSVDIPAAMRSVLQIIKNPDNEYERIAVHVKCSNAPKGQSIVYTIGDRGGVQWIGFSPMTDDDLTTVVKRKEKGVPYENEPLVQVFNQLITDRPGGGFWSYADLKSEGANIIGFPPYSDINDLRTKLSGHLARELQEKDGLIVTCGAKGAHGVRGIKIERYQHPKGYQTKMQGGA